MKKIYYIRIEKWGIKIIYRLATCVRSAGKKYIRFHDERNIDLLKESEI